jgi:hypothetical protein
MSGLSSAARDKIGAGAAHKKGRPKPPLRRHRWCVFAYRLAGGIRFHSAGGVGCVFLQCRFPLLFQGVGVVLDLPRDLPKRVRDAAFDDPAATATRQKIDGIGEAA